MAGFGYAAGQAAILLLLAAVLGVVAGWLIRSIVVRPDATVHRQLDAARQEANGLRATVSTLKAEVQAVADRKETEMGRLESGAITTLETVISTHRGRIAALETDLHSARLEMKHSVRQLEIELRRSSRLEAVISQRDERLAAMAEDVAERDRRPAPGPG